MKWPNTLTIIRHGESAYNLLKKNKRENPDYEKFLELFAEDYEKAEDEKWPSKKLVVLARKVWQKTRLGFDDYHTPLTEEGFEQAKSTASSLKKVIKLPDVIYFSPSLRTKETLKGLVQGWPELAKVKAVSEERVREQEHGLQTIYNDWRVFCTLNPVQGLLFKQEGDYFYRQANGENKADVRDRVRSFMATIIREDAGQNVLLLSHHITLLCFRANLERWSPEKFIEIDKADKPINCGVTMYGGDPKQGENGKLILKTYNQKLY